MRMCYVAIPYSHFDSEIREYRFQISNLVSAKLLTRGWTVFSPISSSHSIAPFIPEKLRDDWGFWSSVDLPFLKICDQLFVVCVDGWDKSVGVADEIKFAHRKGIPVEYITESLTRVRPTPQVVEVVSRGGIVLQCPYCPNTFKTRKSHLSRSVSCGCARNNKTDDPTFPYRKTHHRLYNRWCKIRSRCMNRKDPAFEDYGGRGIQVCEEWTDFGAFLLDMAPTFEEGLSIDRIDNDGDYCRDNCRWTDAKTQAENRRSNIILEVDGVSKTISQWAGVTGVPAGNIAYRYHAGWSHRECIHGR